MTQLLILISVINSLLFKGNRKTLLYIFTLMIPYLGFIQIKISSFTVLAPLIHDLIFVIPIIIIFISSIKIPPLPTTLKFTLIFFILILFLQFINPWGPSILVKLVGLKVWLFYFLLIPVGMMFVEKKEDLKKFCNIFAISSIIPFIIGIAQFTLSQIFSSLEVFTFFYGDFETAKGLTQNFTYFQFGDIKIFRVTSTFSFIAQYNNFILISFIPIITSIMMSNTLNEKKFYKLVLLIAMIAALTSGTRANFIFFGVFFVTFYSLYKNLHIAQSILIFLCLILIAYFFYFISPFVEGISDLVILNLNEYFFIDFVSTFTKNIFGNGLGSGTNAARYMGLFSTRPEFLHEGYYIKTIYELGALGLFSVLLLFINFNNEILKSKKNSEHLKESIFCILFYSYFIWVIIFSFKGASLFDNFPTNLLFLLFLGMVIKIGSKEYLDQYKNKDF